VIVLARIAAVVLGVVAFLAGALVLQLARGLEDGALVDPAGTVVAAVPAGWAWVVGATVAVVAFVIALLARPGRWSWLLFGGTLLVLLIVGTAVGFAGADSVVTWAVAGLAVALGIRTRRIDTAS
jgi:hypothetical protein